MSLNNIIERVKKYNPPSSFSPLKIVCELITPIALAHPYIHLDGLIMHLLLRDILKDDYYNLPSKSPIDFGQYLRPPLKKSGKVYHASVSFFDIQDVYVTTIYKRFCTEYLDHLTAHKKKIRRGTGHFKDFMIRLPYIPAKTVTFYANGNIGEIERLLAALEALGKKTAYGFGLIRSIEVEEMKEDWSVVKNGKAMRPIPMSMLDYAEKQVALAYKPPYWDKRNVAICVPPGAEVRLHG
ncbi:hypothetical protein B6U67_00730 [Methanosarcinales archaeon ex4484_138]|nr:MAG: hypothetical protein B6U67_00730 [Methanosarcinales archaeon ex4484_138]